MKKNHAYALSAPASSAQLLVSLIRSDLVRDSSHVGLSDTCALQVAQVTQIFADKKDNATFSVFWYYFPDDVKRGRQVCLLIL